MATRLTVIDDSILDRIGVATPCEADWNAMGGNDRVRHCADCKQSVYDISALGRYEAAALIQASEGRLCVRLFRRPDGTLITSDCWARLRAARRRGVFAFVCVAVLVGLAQLAIHLAGLRAFFGSERVGVRTMGEMQMGDVAMVAPPPAPTVEQLPPPPEPRPLMGKIAFRPEGQRHEVKGRLRIVRD